MSFNPFALQPPPTHPVLSVSPTTLDPEQSASTPITTPTPAPGSINPFAFTPAAGLNPFAFQSQLPSTPSTDLTTVQPISTQPTTAPVAPTTTPSTANPFALSNPFPLTPQRPQSSTTTTTPFSFTPSLPPSTDQAVGEAAAATSNPFAAVPNTPSLPAFNNTPSTNPNPNPFSASFAFTPITPTKSPFPASSTSTHTNPFTAQLHSATSVKKHPDSPPTASSVLTNLLEDADIPLNLHQQLKSLLDDMSAGNDACIFPNDAVVQSCRQWADVLDRFFKGWTSLLAQWYTARPRSFSDDSASHIEWINDMIKDINPKSTIDETLSDQLDQLADCKKQQSTDIPGVAPTSGTLACLDALYASTSTLSPADPVYIAVLGKWVGLLDAFYPDWPRCFISNPHLTQIATSAGSENLVDSLRMSIGAWIMKPENSPCVYPAIFVALLEAQTYFGTIIDPQSVDFEDTRLNRARFWLKKTYTFNILVDAISHFVHPDQADALAELEASLSSTNTLNSQNPNQPDPQHNSSTPPHTLPTHHLQQHHQQQQQSTLVTQEVLAQLFPDFAFNPQFGWFAYLLSKFSGHPYLEALQSHVSRLTDPTNPYHLSSTFSFQATFLHNNMFNTYGEFLDYKLPQLQPPTSRPTPTSKNSKGKHYDKQPPSLNSIFTYFPNDHPLLPPLSSDDFDSVFKPSYFDFFLACFLFGKFLNTTPTSYHFSHSAADYASQLLLSPPPSFRYLSVAHQYRSFLANHDPVVKNLLLQQQQQQLNQQQQQLEQQQQQQQPTKSTCSTALPQKSPFKQQNFKSTTPPTTVHPLSAVPLIPSASVRQFLQLTLSTLFSPTRPSAPPLSSQAVCDQIIPTLSNYKLAPLVLSIFRPSSTPSPSTSTSPSPPREAHADYLVQYFRQSFARHAQTDHAHLLHQLTPLLVEHSFQLYEAGCDTLHQHLALLQFNTATIPPVWILLAPFQINASESLIHKHILLSVHAGLLNTTAPTEHDVKVSQLWLRSYPPIPTTSFFPPHPPSALSQSKSTSRLGKLTSTSNPNQTALMACHRATLIFRGIAMAHLIELTGLFRVFSSNLREIARFLIRSALRVPSTVLPYLHPVSRQQLQSICILDQKVPQNQGKFWLWCLGMNIGSQFAKAPLDLSQQPERMMSQVLSDPLYHPQRVKSAVLTESLDLVDVELSTSSEECHSPPSISFLPSQLLFDQPFRSKSDPSSTSAATPASLRKSPPGEAVDTAREKKQAKFKYTDTPDGRKFRQEYDGYLQALKTKEVGVLKQGLSIVLKEAVHSGLFSTPPAPPTTTINAVEQTFSTMSFQTTAPTPTPTFGKFVEPAIAPQPSYRFPVRLPIPHESAHFTAINRSRWALELLLVAALGLQPFQHPQHLKQATITTTTPPKPSPAPLCQPGSCANMIKLPSSSSKQELLVAQNLTHHLTANFFSGELQQLLGLKLSSSTALEAVREPIFNQGAWSSQMIQDGPDYMKYWTDSLVTTLITPTIELYNHINQLVLDMSETQ